jgi:hypothetical protein
MQWLCLLTLSLLAAGAWWSLIWYKIEENNPSKFDQLLSFSFSKRICYAVETRRPDVNPSTPHYSIPMILGSSFISLLTPIPSLSNQPTHQWPSTAAIAY